MDVRAREKLWDESQHPRDQDGKFTDSGGVAFVSPNVEDLKFDDALKEMESRRQLALRHASYDVDRQLGKDPVEATNVVGAWSDGAENSLALVMPKDWSHEQIKVAMAMKGWLGDQKSALIFTPDANGNSYIASIPLQGDLGAMHQELLDAGLAFHTLQPTDGGALVHVYGDDQSTMDAVDALAGKHDVKAEFTFGNGEFIGTTKTDGTDREQRDDARSQYEAIIGAPEAGAAFEGRDLGKIWQDTRDRWGGELSPKEVDEHGRQTGGIFPIDAAAVEAKTEANVAAAAAASDQKPLSGSKATHPATIATRNPTAKGSVEAYGQPDVASMKLDPKRYEKDIQKFENGDFYSNFRKDDFKDGTDQAVTNMVTQMKDNLKFLYQFADKNTQIWYDGARALVDDRTKLYGFNDASVAAVYAALSPTKDWDQNVHIADMLLQTYKQQQDHKWDDKMSATAKDIWSAKNQAVVKLVEGKTLAELDTPAKKALWIRTYDEAHNSTDYRQVLPDGSLGDTMRNKDGTPSKVVWQSLPSIANAVKALEANGDRKAISDAMGTAHKVRSFYNNILDPHSANGDVTIDTHAVGAALLRQLSGSDVPVVHNFGNTPMKADQPPGWAAVGSSTKTGLSGTYPVYAQAYREAAHELGIQPRQLQSAVWVVKRDTFGNASKKTQADIETAWHSYHDNPKVTLEATRNTISDLLGLKQYGTQRRHFRIDRGGRAPGDEADLHRGGLGRQHAVDGGDGAAAARGAAGLDAVRGEERRAGVEALDQSQREAWRVAKIRAIKNMKTGAHTDWMNECVPTLMDLGKDQIVAVAACLNMWRDAWEESHPDGADDPGPSPKEADENSPLASDKRLRPILARARTLLREWDESKHPRVPAGSPDGGEFGEGGGGDSGGAAPKTAQSKGASDKAFAKIKAAVAAIPASHAAQIAHVPVVLAKSSDDFPSHIAAGGGANTVGLFGWANDQPRIDIAETVKATIKQPPQGAGFDTPIAQWVAMETALPVRQPEQVTVHELAHAFDYVNDWKPSADPALNQSFAVAVKKMTTKEAASANYWIKGGQREMFAELYSMIYSPNRGEDQRYFGGMRRARAEKIFAAAIPQILKIKRLDLIRRAPTAPTEGNTGWFVNEDGELYALLNGMPYAVDVAGTPLADMHLVPGDYADIDAVMAAANTVLLAEPIDEKVMAPIRNKYRKAHQDAHAQQQKLHNWYRAKAEARRLLKLFDESKHPRDPKTGEFSETGGSGSDDSKRREGETDKEFAKRVVDKRPAPKELPEKHEDYFKMEGATVMPLDKLVSSKSDEENKQGGDNGAKRMIAAANGELSKRDPITVEPMGDGKYLITDGNGTFTTVQKYGWKAIPVKIEGGAVPGYKAGVKAAGYIDDVRDQWVKESPIKTMDDVIRAAPIAQASFNEVGNRIAKKLGVQFIAAGPKTHTLNKETGQLEIRPAGIARIAEKVEERSKKEGKPTPIARITDTARGTFVLNGTADAQKVINELAKTHEIVVENWRTVPSSWYTDRALLFRDRETGLIGELQLAHPEMLRAKETGGGHGLYEKARSLPKGDIRIVELNLKMRALYGKVLDSLHADWKEIDGRH